MDEEEPPFDPIANLDQALMEIKTLAKILRGFYTALVSEGFTDEQALDLTITQLQKT